MEQCPRDRIPQLDSPINTATHEGLSIRADSDGMHTICMPSENAEWLLCMQVPNPDRLILAATDKKLPIGTDNNGPHAICVSKEYAG